MLSNKRIEKCYDFFSTLLFINFYNFISYLSNTGVWLSLCLFMILRGLSLFYYLDKIYPKIWEKNNKTWLSSQSYIQSFNNFLIKNIKINSNSKILDIGCGRGKILGSLSSKLKLKEKPLGIDIVNHKDRDKRINFKRINVLNFSLRKDQKFDLILIKQTIHLMKLSEVKKLLKFLKKSLNPKGKILIFTLDTSKNEIPTFKLMKHKLNKSLKRDKKILKIITKLYPHRIKKKFIFNVKIGKKIFRYD